MPDYGTNTTLAFNSKVTSFNAVQVRTRKLEHNWDVVYTESHARRHRAFYPHRRAVSGFAITIELKGYSEFRPFMTFMGDYIKTFMGADRKSMLVSCPARRFSRWGIPVSGVYDGDHVGTAVIAPTIYFEGMQDPLDLTILTGNTQDTASADLAGVTGDQAKFFYPFSEGSRNPNVRAENLYDTVGAPSSAQELLDRVSGGGGNTAADAVGGALDAIGRNQSDAGTAAGR